MEESVDLEFAPVIIPTLCRYIHFKRCIESLMKCTHANNTTVYIGLDYPSKKQHWEGYRKIISFLKSIENSHSFKDLIVIKRERNYGVGPNGNLSQLREMVFSMYDTIILSEDDNEFAPAFLDYCNKGLKKYKEDKSIIAILGYTPIGNIQNIGNTFFCQNIDFVAWGYAIWKDRQIEFDNLNPNWFWSHISLRKLMRIAKRFGNIKAYECLSYSLPSIHQFRVIDRVASCYLILTNRKVIMPIKSLVRNLGTDGTGESFHHISEKDTLSFKNQELYDKSKFEFIGTGSEYYNHNELTIKRNNRLNITKTKLIVKSLRRIFTSIYAVIYNNLRKHRLLE